MAREYSLDPAYTLTEKGTTSSTFSASFGGQEKLIGGFCGA